MTRRNFGYGLTAALAGCGRRHARGAPIRIALARAGILYLPVHIARSLEHFREEGAAVEFYETSGGSKAMEALLGGSADAMISGHSQVVQVAVQGKKVRTVICLSKSPGTGLVLAPGSNRQSIADLKGVAIGVTSPGSSSHLELNCILATGNIQPHEISVVGIGTQAAATAALERRRVEAGMLASNTLSAFLLRHPTARVLADLRTPEGIERVTGATAYPGVCLASTDEWLSRNAPQAQMLCRALQRAMRWILEHRPEESLDRLPADSRSNDAAADLEAIRQQIAVLNPNGAMTVEMVKTTKQMLSVSIPQVVSLDGATTFTNEFL